MANPPQWQPYREPARVTAFRTLAIALVAALPLARFGLGMRNYPLAVGLVLWFSVGGHFVELFFLNWLRFRLPSARPAQLVARLCVWFAGGVVLGYGAYETARLAGLWISWLLWWITGLAFIAVELAAHIPIHLRGRPSFYNGLA